MHKEIIVTIDIGSSKIIAAAGTKDEKGAVRMLALETEGTQTSVRKGRIYYIEEVSQKIRVLINRLNFKLNGKISKVYVGLGGQSLMTENHEKSESYQPDLWEVLDDTQSKFILGYSSLKLNLNRCISENSDIEIAGYFVAPIATATATLTEQEKKSGCALIEFGAGVTYLSVYKNNLLKYLVSIPVGGSAITNDIYTLDNLEDVEEAEELKIKYGNALRNNETDDSQTITALKHREINIETFNDIVEARTEEIIANIQNQLNMSGFADVLRKGIIITGGGAALKNLAESIKEKIMQEVRIAHIKDELIGEGSLKYKQTPGIEETFGLLSLGTQNCVKEIAKQIVPPAQTIPVDLFGKPIEEKHKKRKFVEKSENIFTRFANKASKGLFDDEDEKINAPNS